MAVVGVFVCFLLVAAGLGVLAGPWFSSPSSSNSTFLSLKTPQGPWVLDVHLVGKVVLLGGMLLALFNAGLGLFHRAQALQDQAKRNQLLLEHLSVELTGEELIDLLERGAHGGKPEAVPKPRQIKLPWGWRLYRGTDEAQPGSPTAAMPSSSGVEV